MNDLLKKIKRHLDPAYAFIMGYLQLFAESAHLGALAVWFDDPETQVSSLGMTPGDALGQQLAQIVFGANVGPEGASRFCTLLREQPAADDRCNKCDAQWIARSKRARKSCAYQCHAGLTEMIVPILVHGKSIGEIMAGQLVQTSALPRGFQDVWERVRMIRGLNKHILTEAFAELHQVDDAEVKRLMAVLETIAQTFGNLIENVAELVVEERQLSNLRGYQERDFVESMLNNPNLSEEEAETRARMLGFEEPPTVAMVARVDFTDQATFEIALHGGQDVFARMIEAAHAVLADIPNALLSSIRPGEIVVVFRPKAARNPELKNLRLREMALRLKTEMETRAAAPVLVGVGSDYGAIGGLGRSYREARLAAEQGTPSLAMTAGSPNEAFLARTTREFLAVIDEIGPAARNPEENALDHILERGLRIIAGCPDGAYEFQRLLFAEMIVNLVNELRREGIDAQSASEALVEFTASYATFRGMDDILEWFHGHIGKLRPQTPCSPHEQVMAQACALVAEHMAELTRAESVNRAEVARLLGMSTTYFGKMFRRQLGITFRDYVQRVRVAAAQKLLLDPRKSVGQVALEVGYSSTAALSRAFEQVCGASPIAYRARPREFKRVEIPVPGPTKSTS